MKCKCYCEEYNYAGDIGKCNGTRERDACSCGGDEAKCDFYPEVRKRAKKPLTQAGRIRSMTDDVGCMSVCSRYNMKEET